MITMILTSYKVLDVNALEGDSAAFFQATENLASKGVATSQTFGATVAYLFQSGYLKMTADELAKSSLNVPSPMTDNILHGHAYYVLYPISLFAKVVPAKILLMALFAITFAGVLLIAYVALRQRNVSILGACLFCLLVASHPAWWQPVLWGQFYPDRLFVLFGLIFMYLASRDKVPMAALAFMGVLCAVTNERGALMAGIFLLAFVVLYWKQLAAKRVPMLILGLCLVGYAVILVKFVLVDVYYSHYLPISIKNLFSEFRYPPFAQKTELFLLVNSPLLLLSLFAPRMAAIAAVMMLPNLIGSIGGGEKIGWSTHYSSYYFPALIWAALLGYGGLFRRAALQRRRVPFYIGIVGLILFISMINWAAYDPISIQPANIRESLFEQLPGAMSTYFGEKGVEGRAEADEIDAAVPRNVIVSTTESGMPFLYRSRTLQFFPADIDSADYAVLWSAKQVKTRVYNGAQTRLGPAEEKKINDVVIRRMRRDGYDFKHAAYFPALGLAVVKRLR
ncbi:MAG TPA: hypothetical protein VMF11_00970 [Candidatus Baltobacteraceae bacterium]|nr:hypothetical protein [Candidatus Baltobacteraceae bacterium]